MKTDIKSILSYIKAPFIVLLGFGLSGLCFYFAIASVYQPNEESIYSEKRIIQKIKQNENRFIFVVDGIPSVFVVNSETSTLNDSIFSKLSSLKIGNEVSLKAYQSITEEQNTLTIFELTIDEKEIISEGAFRDGQIDASILPFSLGGIFFLITIFLMYMSINLEKIQNASKKKFKSKLEEEFNILKEKDDFYLIEYSDQKFLFFHHLVIQIQKNGNQDVLHWKLWNKEDLPKRESFTLKNTHPHNLSFGLRAEKLKSKLSKKINEKHRMIK